jgi:hypothetical protein
MTSLLFRGDQISLIATEINTSVDWSGPPVSVRTSFPDGGDRRFGAKGFDLPFDIWRTGRFRILARNLMQEPVTKNSIYGEAET